MTKKKSSVDWGADINAALESGAATIKEAAEMLKRKYSTSRRDLQDWRKAMGIAPSTTTFDVELEPVPTYEGDSVIVGDVHSPCTDWAMATRVGMIGQQYGIRRLIVAGDMVNADWASTYAKIVPLPTWQQEIAGAKECFALWLTVFDEIVVLAGNHERRIQRVSNGEMGMPEIVAQFTTDPRVKVTNRGQCLLVSAGQTFRVTHGRQYRANQLSVAQDLALKYQQHIISHHEHHAAVGWDKFKRYIIVNNGALVDQAKLAYVNIDDSTMPNMAKAFTMVRNGTPYLLGEAPLTDWSVWI